jgi:hypothetical protein
MSGQLPPGEPADDSFHARRRRAHKPSIEDAARTFFMGFGFILAALAVLLYFPVGFTWGWSWFIPFVVAKAGGRIEVQAGQQEEPRREIEFRIGRQPDFVVDAGLGGYDEMIVERCGKVSSRLRKNGPLARAREPGLGCRLVRFIPSSR